MESGRKDCEEETLQTAFKKLRVDAESLVAAVPACDSLPQRAPARANTEGAKPKENWHGCMRKASRGAVRSQRRRRSKSPILHPPKFSYCNSKVSSPPGHLKHKSTADVGEGGGALAVPAKKELLFSRSPLPVFGSGSGYKPQCGAAHGPEIKVTSTDTPCLSPHPGPSDFQALSKLQEAGGCRCADWQGVEVYSFTGLRSVISECERKLAGAEDTAQATSPQRPTRCSSTSTGSPRSCSEQARSYVDDITIEDLSGYMEFYLYIPKKMSHMAEMMYT